SEISDASYQSARDRLCHLLEMTARLDQASEGIGGQHAQWMNLGPEGRHVQENAVDPCGPAGRGAWRSPLTGNDNEIVFYRGAVSIDGKSFLGGTARHGTLRGTESGVWRTLLDGTGGFVAVDPFDAENIFAAQSGLWLGRSFDGGGTFVEAGQGIDDIGL